MKFKQKITIMLVLTAIIPQIIGLGLSLSRSIGMLKENTLKQTLDAAIVEAERISQYYLINQRIVRQYAYTPIMKDMDWEIINPYLNNEIIRPEVTFEKMILSRPNGTYFLTDDIGNSNFEGLQTVDNNSPTGTLLKLKKEEYWKRTLGGSANVDVVFVDDPVISSIDGKIHQIIASSIINKDEDLLGMIGGSIDFELISNEMAKSKETLSKKIKGDFEYFIISRKATYLYHQDKEMMIHKSGDELVKPTIHDQKGFDDFMFEIITGKTDWKLYTDPDTGQNKYVFYAHVDSIDGSFVIIIPTDFINKEIMTSLKTQIILLVLILVLVVLAGTILGGTMSKSISNASKMVWNISQGDGDLTQRLDVSSRDEIGDMGKNFNHFLNTMEKLVFEIHNQTDTLRDIGVNLNDNSSETATSVNEMTSNINSIESLISRQYTSLGGTRNAINDISKYLNILTSDINDQAQTINTSSASIENMVSIIQGEEESMKLLDQYFSDLHTQAEQGNTQVQIASEQINTVSALSESLQEANRTIAEITDQTSLLAMNAAIEAAHAGDAGRGFSVVADEIRKLSVSSAEQSNKISSNLNNILKAISESVDSSSVASVAFNKMSVMVEQVRALQIEIKKSVDEQSIESRQILNDLNGMKQITLDVAKSSEKMKIGEDAIYTEIESLTQISDEVKNSVKELILGTNEINRAMTNIQEISEDNSENIDEVSTLVGRFKITNNC